MAYSDDQWAKVRALYEVGKSMPEIIEQADIKDRASIYRKAKTDGWSKGQNATLVQKKVEAKQTLALADAEIATKSDIERDIINTAVAEQLAAVKFFRGANMLVANTVAIKVKEQGRNASFMELAQAATALTKTQEAVLGKAPEMVINNNNAVQTVIQYTPEQLRKLNQDLEDAC